MPDTQQSPQKLTRSEMWELVLTLERYKATLEDQRAIDAVVTVQIQLQRDLQFPTKEGKE